MKITEENVVKKLPQKLSKVVQMSISQIHIRSYKYINSIKERS